MHRLLIASCLLLVACAPAQLKPLSPLVDDKLNAANDVWRIHFIDIGQGLAVLNEFPCGAMLVDTGGEDDQFMVSDDVLVRYLEGFFARRTDLNRTIDLLALTHPHIDHTRGTEAVLKRFRVRNAIDNGMEQGSGGVAQNDLHRWADSHRDMRYFPIRQEEVNLPNGLNNDVIDPFRCKDIDPQVRALWGAVPKDPGWGNETRYGKTPFQNLNNHSLVLRVDFGKSSALFTGDLEVQAIGTLLKATAGTSMLDVDLYQVGHHGSFNGTTPELVEAMSPKVSVLSMGSPEWRDCQWCGFAYGHPRATVIEMLDRGMPETQKRKPIEALVSHAPKTFQRRHIEKAIYGTGWDGNVVVEMRADGAWRVVTSGRLGK
jgi:competence protein ComEC